MIKMQMEDIIYKRQSIRSYADGGLDDETLNNLEEFIGNAKVLNPNINWSYEIVDTSQFKTPLPWKAPHYILMYSEKKDNYRQNIGFIFQQVDLYLQCKGIGTCWIGMGKPRDNNKKQEYIIAMAIGRPAQEIYRNKEEFQRNKLNEISDVEDEKLIPAQLAPSAGNSQPWYFVHNNDESISIYRKKLGLVKRRLFGRWSPTDIGIALAHIYVSNRESFNYYLMDNPEQFDGCVYEGTFNI